MRCPYCRHPVTSVVDSRAPEAGAVIRRRRECGECGKRFTTFERVSFSLPYVIKNNGARVEFDRTKIRSSMGLALRKRPVSQERIDEVVDYIEQALVVTGEREIQSRTVGELVLEALKHLDVIGYIRFASVYFNIQDPACFADMITRAVRGREDLEAEKNNLFECLCELGAKCCSNGVNISSAAEGGATQAGGKRATRLSRGTRQALAQERIERQQKLEKDALEKEKARDVRMKFGDTQ